VKGGVCWQISILVLPILLVRVVGSAPVSFRFPHSSWWIAGYEVQSQWGHRQTAGEECENRLQHPQSHTYTPSSDAERRVQCLSGRLSPRLLSALRPFTALVRMPVSSMNQDSTQEQKLTGLQLARCRVPGYLSTMTERSRMVAFWSFKQLGPCLAAENHATDTASS
jgi:hypothetical protein